VLLVGGYVREDAADSVLYPDPVIYDASKDTWTSAGHLDEARAFQRAYLLSGGDVLVLGGSGGTLTHRVPAELIERYNTESSEWSVVGDMSEAVPGEQVDLGMNVERVGTDRFLVAGFWRPAPNCGGATSPATQVFDPATGGWSAGPAFDNGRRYAATAELADGSVVVVGGNRAFEIRAQFGGGCDQFSRGEGAPVRAAPGDILFHRVADTHVNTGGIGYPNVTMRALSSGGAVLQGGSYPTGDVVDVLDPVSEQWVPHSGMLQARHGAAIQELQGHRVLIAGGTENDRDKFATVEVLDLATGRWFGGGTMHEARLNAASVALDDGRVLVVGGDESGTAEIYESIGGGLTDYLPIVMR
jgi:hypothetical protein